MSGAFLMSREIFNHDIWNDVPKFRIFFYIVGNAVFSEKGVTKGGIHIGRGQYLRSYRNIREDLAFIDNNAEKYYALSMIKRKIDELVKEEMLTIEETKLGTLFTVTNYYKYQGFEHYKKDSIEQPKNIKRTPKEQPENVSRTEIEQPENNNNYVINDINALKGSKELTTTSTTAPAAAPENGFAKALQTFEANLCKLSPLQMEELGQWFDDFGGSYEILEEAIKISADRNKKTFGFFAYLLKEWSDNKLTTIEQVQSHERNKFNNAAAKKSAGNYQPRSNYGNKPMREEKLPEWFGQAEPPPEKIPETVPADTDVEAARRKWAEKYGSRNDEA